MKWTSIKLHLLPLIMQEIEVCEKNYVELINKLKTKKTKQLIDQFLEMRTDISKRIGELEEYFDENFGNVRMNILEKGIFQLKRLLFYNPDKNNDQEEADLPEFTGLVIDFNQIQKNSLKNQEFSKNIRQNASKGQHDAKMRSTMKPNMRNNKYPQNVRKTVGGPVSGGGANLRENGMMSKSKTIQVKEKDEKNDITEEDDFGGKKVKKKLKIKLTDEEFRLLQKLKAKKKNGSQ